MNSVLEMKEYAEDYLFSRFRKSPEIYKMQGSLNYLLCTSFDRIKAEFGEVTKHDVALLIESWIMAQGTAAGRQEPLWDTSKIPF